MIKNEAGTWNKAGFIKGASIGGIIGTAAALLDIYGLFNLPGFSSILTANPVTSAFGITAAGTLIGGGLGGLFRLSEFKGETGEDNNYKLQLREEKLDIVKERIQTAIVKIHKEVIHEEKNIVVPITREELVVEKQVLGPHNPEIIRIPLKEERVVVNKNSVVLNDVTINKQEKEDFVRVEDTLKKEELVVERQG